jgi:hypothetical protein
MGGVTRRRRPRAVELLLLAALLAALGWVALLRRGHPTAGGSNAIGPGPELGPPTRITFPSGHDSIVVVRTGDEYEVIHPVQDRAAPLFVAEVLHTIGGLTANRVLEGAADRTYGLEGPGPVLRLVDAAGRSWSLRLGDEAPVGSLFYARVGPPPAPTVMLDRFTARKYFLPELRTVRDPAATALRPGPIDSVMVLVPGRDLYAARIGREFWKVRAPAGLDADPATLNGVVRLLRDANILDYPPPGASLRALGLDPPRAVWVLCQGSRRDTVRIGHGTSDQKGVFVRPAHRSTPAILPSERFRSLVDGWPSLVDRRLLRLPTDSIIAVEFPGRQLSLRREKDGWRRFPGGTELQRPAGLDQDLANLAALRWVRYPLPEEPPPRGSKRLMVRLATPSVAETLLLAAPVDTVGWARATRAPRWGRVSAAAWIAWSYRAAHGE